MKRVHITQIWQETGISADYWNEYTHRPIWFSSDFSPKTNLRSLEMHHIKRYTERFSDKVYDDVITPKNQQRVARLDEIADKVNAIATPEKFSINTFRDLVCEAYKLVCGKSIELKPETSE